MLFTKNEEARLCHFHVDIVYLGLGGGGGSGHCVGNIASQGAV